MYNSAMTEGGGTVHRMPSTSDARVGWDNQMTSSPTRMAFEGAALRSAAGLRVPKGYTGVVDCKELRRYHIHAEMKPSGQLPIPFDFLTSGASTLLRNEPTPLGKLPCAFQLVITNAPWMVGRPCASLPFLSPSVLSGLVCLHTYLPQFYLHNPLVPAQRLCERESSLDQEREYKERGKRAHRNCVLHSGFPHLKMASDNGVDYD
ncbi:hypothetical protein EW146_g9216 [Bondarzewia mesenterica]|uniref:Uncharacterized protein n=1 Tax=Bondarzewia mesenterica TaxID=1095465 RepID=A0A4S4L8B9_9AGAM|nr:hypothetical protein EW146_g9216 [Bondarzewia mesenterica]